MPDSSPPRKRPARSRAAAPDKPAIFSRSSDEILRRLKNGALDPEAELYFGEHFDELSEAARSLSSRSRTLRGGLRPKVLILPGIMGSQLGTLGGILNDVLWLDPLDVAWGNWKRLALGADEKVVALDPIPLLYLPLKLRLLQAGFDAEDHPFDWRQSIESLGAALKRRLDFLAPEKVHLAVHSMGTLVARAALKQGATNIGKVVMMGPPNSGSYAPVLAFRGANAFGAHFANLDQTHDNDQLAEQVFGTFPGLAEMLPLGSIAHGLDWREPKLWPGVPRTSHDVLRNSRSITSKLAEVPSDWRLIAGVDQETIELGELDLESEGFRYKRSFKGDGTVPLASARPASLPDSHVYYVKHGHGTLPANWEVMTAVIELLQDREVTSLSRTLPEVRPAPEGWLTDRELRRQIQGTAGSRPRIASRASRPSVRDAARALYHALDQPFGLPPSEPALAAAPRTRLATTARPPRIHGVVISQEDQFFLELELALGNIAEVESEAIVLAQFQNMDLGRAGQAVDAKMDGVLSQIIQRRMFSAHVGEMFVLPARRSHLRTDVVAIAGLGARDSLVQESGQLRWETLELIAENTMRTLLSAGVTEFATLLFGNLGEAPPELMKEGLRYFMQGFLRGLTEADHKRRLRRVTICEANPERYQNLCDALLELLVTPLFRDIKVRLEQTDLPEPQVFPHRTLSASAAGDAGRDPTYLFVRVTGNSNFELTLVPPVGNAAASREPRPLTKEDLQRILDPVKFSSWDASVSEAEVKVSGTAIAELLIHPDQQRTLLEHQDSPLILVHDEEASRIPWETLRLVHPDGSEYLPARGPGMSRQYAAANLSVAKWVEKRRAEKTLHVLLIADPTSDLEAAREEGKRVMALFGGHPGMKVTRIEGEEATRDRLLMEFRSGAYDIVHYAGHAFFDPESPVQSGLICAPKDDKNPSVLSGSDLSGLGQLPMLVFFNACESARVRGRLGKAGNHPNRVLGFASMAEALMRGGVANLLGTYWPVRDASAKDFAASFYENVLAGLPMGRCVTTARQAVLAAGSPDWADYVHYGSPNFVLKPKVE